MSESPIPSPAEPGAKCCQNPWVVSLIVSIFGIIVPPLVGVSGTVFGMVKAFDTIGTDGKADPAAFSEDISGSIVATAIGLGISFIFLIIFVISLVKVLSNRERK
ncbi:MAG: MotA/TolQ/ExbB proton channel family protein [Verrucomicrobiales bacterium]|nr:MotA/TolQ/ExbB proton channel family protein [Verrucomicrobiales bacterium]